MAFVFWTSIGLIAYVYAGYPLLLAVWSACRRLSNPQSALRNPQFPGVSIVIAARNEGPRIAARIENLLSLDYPASRRQIIVVSDGSTDETLDVLFRYQKVAHVISVPAGGKANALNVGVARATNEIVIFADARQVFARDALRELVAPFADPEVGAVSGELLLDAESALFSNRREAKDRRRGHAGQLRSSGIERRIIDRRRSVASTIADGVGMYWRYEKQLRRLESEVGSMLGATGAIYAIRRSLWQPLPAGTLLDDVLTPMRIVLQGFRVVFTDRARAFDRAPVDAEQEARRKVRTLAGNYQLMALEPRLLLPWRNPVWLQYVSHKLGRLAVAYALLTMFAATIALATRDWIYMTALVAQVSFYLLAGYGALVELSARREISRASTRTAEGAKAVAGDPLQGVA
ncbi:MAG TPA: glycosyltransferase family 2 protein [Vicinamibacterales bacterium]|nr:glycosyltransferase family 2 protein [Vicinamibacterales bacterium]